MSRLFPINYTCIIIYLFFSSCSFTKIIQDSKYKSPEKYNLRFEGSDANINEPSKDRRSYYLVYINKLEKGRTTIGLESQMKTYQTRLSRNRHVLIIEKWVLDKRKKQYIKLNNIEQPKPNYVYFDIVPDRIVLIKFKSNYRTQKAIYEVGFELKE